MKDVRGSQTEINLMKSFAGESQARNRYTYFSSKAAKEGYRQIAAIFETTANQEKEHAERFFKFLKGGTVEVKAMFPAGVISSTRENLIEAAEGEYDEWHNLYPEFARVARAEGFDAIAEVWEHIVIAEKHHEERYRALLANIEDDTVFKKNNVIVWQCLNCGYIHVGQEAPEVCPACAHQREYFAVFDEKFN